MKLIIFAGLGLFAILQSVDVGSAAPFVGSGIIATQILLLWRVRSIEREQGYQGRVSHWENNVLQQIAFKMDLKLPLHPERTDG